MRDHEREKAELQQVNEERPSGKKPNMNQSENALEQELLDALTEGEMEEADPKQAARQILPPKYEIRIQSTWDPIVEETKIYRSMAKEVDDRYDKYMERAAQNPKENEETDQNKQ